MKRKILFIPLPVLAVAFLITGIYGAIMVYEWAKVKDAEFLAEIAESGYYTSYHPGGILILAVIPLYVGIGASIYCLHSLWLLRRNEIP